MDLVSAVGLFLFISLRWLLPLNGLFYFMSTSFSAMERKTERGEEGEQERKKGKEREGGKEERKREGERREGGRKERKNLPGRMCSYQRLPHFLLLFGLDDHIRSVMSTQEGGVWFFLVAKVLPCTKKEGLNMGSFLAQVRISGNGDSFKYLFHKRL